ncbi:DNA polymerase/3'-5' exonuclease PolX [Methylacidimicrobium cyclopophantes]|uniref:DNA-directed DNA polymerase n=1 Tax=Methylacidimicrobium cyclopophantes TaxID=1041766 RepID=A0A5E6MEH6_9BACT|nr:DNA polymerase/3'-5' exonuclease PolX [Methylacidimicrobium cyclopophantes]VVM06661.1 DNA polymerase/3'-5' exonuclease PolX [Methylacidimicrobium cyclopophantes]
MTKDEAVAKLEQIATLLDLRGENPFKSRAYRTAARALESLSEDFESVVREGKLDQVKGIGEGIRAKLQELVATGRLTYLEELERSFPAGVVALLEIPGLGPKKVKILWEQLGIRDLEELEAACRSHRVGKLSGFGSKTEENILAGIEQRRSYAAYHRYGDVIGLAEHLVEQLRAHPDVVRVSMAGSFRRGKEIVRDLDLVCSSAKPAAVMAAFISSSGVQRVVNHGETKSSVILEGGLACDLRVVPDEDYPYALLHFTGSKEHNIALRQRAIAQGKKLSEWGLFREARSRFSAGSEDTASERESEGERIRCRDEAEIYAKLGLAYIPPELRENLGEVEAAERNEIPRLVEWTDLRGTFHCHTTASDGHSTLKAMAEAAQESGLEYLGIADHSKSSFQANGLDEERVALQQEEIRKRNKEFRGFRLLSGTECDILRDGRLDFSDSVLASFDYVVASVHAGFSTSEEEMTRRIIRAMENPYVTMLGHPTGRLLLMRKPYPVNLEKIIDCAAETGTWIELNAQPLRLDLDWRWWHAAREKGVRCVINPDAHHVRELGFVRIGVNIARKGWLRREDVINTLPLKLVEKALRKKRGGGG